jgi:hypothetical protein
MPTVLRSCLLLLSPALLALAPAARASTLGLVDPYGSPAVTGVGSAYWDTFPSVAYTGDTPDSADNDVFTGTLSSTSAGNPPAGVYGTGTRIYIHDGQFNFSSSLSATASIQSLTLQLKFTNPGAPLTVADLFTVSASFGGTPSFATHGTVTEGANTFNIVTYTWSGLSLASGDLFTVSAVSQANAFSTIDGLRLDAAAIPEPASAAALLGLGALAFPALRRRR